MKRAVQRSEIARRCSNGSLMCRWIESNQRRDAIGLEVEIARRRIGGCVGGRRGTRDCDGELVTHGYPR